MYDHYPGIYTPVGIEKKFYNHNTLELENYHLRYYDKYPTRYDVNDSNFKSM